MFGLAETAGCAAHAGGGTHDAHFLTVKSPKIYLPYSDILTTGHHKDFLVQN